MFNYFISNRGFNFRCTVHYIMDYKVLSRKYSHQTFNEIIGQSHIVDTLTNSISTNRLAHGYLFSGLRGVGKTTTARVLSKTLNCLDLRSALQKEYLSQ